MPSLQQQTALKRKVKEAVIRIATFAIEHNISFNALDHLAKLNKEIEVMSVKNSLLKLNKQLEIFIHF